MEDHRQARYLHVVGNPPSHRMRLDFSVSISSELLPGQCQDKENRLDDVCWHGGGGEKLGACGSYAQRKATGRPVICALWGTLRHIS